MKPIPSKKAEAPAADLETLRIAHAARPHDKETASNSPRFTPTRAGLKRPWKFTRRSSDARMKQIIRCCWNTAMSVPKQETDQAVRIFKKLTALKPQRVEGWNNLGIVQHALGEDDAALESFQKVLDLEPDNAGALLNIGNCFAKKGMVDQAVDFFTKNSCRPARFRRCLV